jgi:predicted nucleic acid-binding protein
MITVANTTPLRYLIEIEAAHILESLFGQIIIPEKVAEELQRPKTPPSVKAWMQNRPAWLEVRSANTSLFTPQRKIHEGERQAIALAIELQANVILIDDYDALKEAHRLKLSTLPLFSILEQAAQNALLDLLEAVRKMRHTSFHMPPLELVDAMLERDRQRKEPTA